MNQVAAALGGAFALAGVGAVAGLLVPARWRSAVVGAATAGVGVAGAVAGIAAVSGTGWRVRLADLLPLAGVSLAVDALAGWFLLLVGGVAAVVGVYTVGYTGRTGHGPSARGALALLPVFVAAMLLVPAGSEAAGGSRHRRRVRQEDRTLQAGPRRGSQPCRRGGVDRRG